MKVAICGSVNSSDKMIESEKLLENLGHQVSLPYYAGLIKSGSIKLEEYIKTKKKEGGDHSWRNCVDVDFYKRYFKIIKQSDCILVVNVKKNGISNYIGGNTLIEMSFAYVLDKKIYLLNPIPEIKYYKDEILDMRPIILNGDLSKIK